MKSWREGKREREMAKEKESGETVQVQRLTSGEYCGTKRNTWITEGNK